MAVLLATRTQVRYLLNSKRAGDDPAGLNADDDAAIDMFLAGWSDFVARYTGRSFEPEPALVDGVDSGSPVTKTFTWNGHGDLRVPDLRTVTSLTYGGMQLNALPGYEPYDLIARDGEPATHLHIHTGVVSPFAQHNRVTITGRWGFLTVPPGLQMAVAQVVARAMRKKDANFSDQVAYGQTGTMMAFFNAMPAEIKMVIDNLRPPRVALV